MCSNHRLLTLDDIRARCIDDGGCWIWQGALAHGQPAMRLPGGRCTTVRRAVLELVKGRRIRTGRVVVAVCGCKACVNPEHLQEVTRSTVTKRAWQRARRQAASVANWRIARARRALPNTRLNEQQVLLIRASEEPCSVLAQRYGCSQSTIRRVKSGSIWRDYASPWAGMGARS